MKTEKDISQIKTKRRINSMTVAICIMIFCISLLQPLELRAALNTDGEEQNLEVQAGSEAGQRSQADQRGGCCGGTGNNSGPVEYYRYGSGITVR